MISFAELLNIFLSNIEKADIDIVKQIASLIPKSQVPYYSEIFNFIVTYYEQNKEFPSANFLEQQFKGIWIRSNEEISKEAVNILLYELNKDATITDTILALQNRDTDKAKAVLDSTSLKADFTETKASDICYLYDSMNELPKGLETGVAPLDNAIKNFSYGTNNFIAAPQKAGKTTAAISLVYDGIMIRGMNAVYITLEVKPFDIYANLYARHAHEIGTNLNAQKVKKNLLSEEERTVLGVVQKSFMDCLEQSGGHLAVMANHDFPEFTIPYLKQYLETKYEEWGRVDLVIIDHMNLCGYAPMKGVSDMKERINIWIKATTDLCKGFHEKGFILISLMQINRQGTLLMKKGKSIGFDILADANEAERSAHTITVMYSNPEMLLTNQVRVYLLANRNGPPLTSESEDNSIETYINPATYIWGHRKWSNSISLSNKDLLKEEDKSQEVDLFSSMI